MRPKLPKRPFLTRFFIILACATGALALASGLLRPSIGHMAQVMEKKADLPIDGLPYYYLAEPKEIGKYRVELTASAGWLSGWVDLVTDDCLTKLSINEQAVTPSTLGGCHYPRSTPVDLRPYLKPGLNVMELTVRNIGGHMGFDMRVEGLPWHMEKIVKSLLVVSLAALLLLRFGAQARWQRPVFWLMLCSLFLSGLQYFASPFDQYAIDIVGHSQYVGFIATQWKLPPPTGWHNQQPPTYYLAAAVFFKVGQWLGMQQPIYAARLLSLFLYIGFLWVSVETVHLYFKGRYVVLASALILFWPDGFTYPGRISNDIPMITSHALTLYLLSRWYFSRKVRWLRYGCFSALFGLALKTTAIIGIGFAGVMLLLALRRRQIGWQFFKDRWLWVVGALCLLPNFGRIAYYRFFEHMDVKWLQNITPAELHILPIVKTPIPYFMYFDISNFIENPFYRDFPSDMDEHFWNPFFKTLLYGEWVWHLRPPAYIVSILFLLMLGLVVAYLLRWSFLQRGADYRPLCPPLIVLVLCMFAALISARVHVPWSGQCNARYIFGIIVPLAIWLAKSTEWHWQQQRFLLAKLSVYVVGAFCALSALMLLFELNLF